MNPNFYNDLVTDIEKYGYDSFRTFVIDKYKEGKSTKQIGLMVHRDASTLRRWLERFGIDRRPPGGRNNVCKNVCKMTI